MSELKPCPFGCSGKWKKVPSFFDKHWQLEHDDNCHLAIVEDMGITEFLVGDRKSINRWNRRTEVSHEQG